MAAGVFFTVFSAAIAILGWWFCYAVWRHRIDFYERSGSAAGLFGEWAYVGYNAGFPLIIASMFTGLTLLGLLITADDMGNAFPQTVGMVVGRTAQAFFFGGSLVGCSLLLFLFPKFLVPPHLRTGRGWIPESVLQARAKWDRRRSGRN